MTSMENFLRRTRGPRRLLAVCMALCFYWSLHLALEHGIQLRHDDDLWLFLVMTWFLPIPITGAACILVFMATCVVRWVVEGFRK